MHRRSFVMLAITGLPLAVQAQPRPRGAPGARHQEMLGQDYDALPPGARDRVTAAFRAGTPELDEASISQRWNAMTPDQRGEVLTMGEGRRAARRAAPPGSGPGPGPGRPPRAAP